MPVGDDFVVPERRKEPVTLMLHIARGLGLPQLQTRDHNEETFYALDAVKSGLAWAAMDGRGTSRPIFVSFTVAGVKPAPKPKNP
jgi:hypothetical protein